MILIAHRGNTEGINLDRENHPDYIKAAQDKDYQVEIDVWYENDKWYLGHDEPQYEVKREYLYDPFYWCHAKNIDALRNLSSLGIHCFWHQTDDVALTTLGYIWTYPGRPLTLKSICVLPETVSYTSQEIEDAAGICSDFIDNYRYTKWPRS